MGCPQHTSLFKVGTSMTARSHSKIVIIEVLIVCVIVIAAKGTSDHICQFNKNSEGH